MAARGPRSAARYSNGLSPGVPDSAFVLTRVERTSWPAQHGEVARGSAPAERQIGELFDLVVRVRAARNKDFVDRTVKTSFGII